MKEEYIAYLTPETKPFNPLLLAEKTRAIVSKEKMLKYTDFYCTGVYAGISTGYAVGCCLRCIFCWVNWSRDFPVKAGSFYSPKQVFEILVRNARKNKVGKLRISGCEPTLCSVHLLSLLDLVDETPYLFILETNGILLAPNPEYIKKLGRYKNIHIRVSIKAATPEGFEQRTGGQKEFVDHPFETISHLIKTNASFHVAAMTDPRLMPREERQLLLKKLRSTGYTDYLEEERCDPYASSLKRLQKAGFKIE